jgi:Flp pilus assembly protein TadG
MALLFPLLVLMLCGTMDFARVFYAGIAVASAARAGVQLGAFSPSNAGKLSSMNAAAVADASGQGLSTITPVSRTYCTCSGSTTEVSCSLVTVCGGAMPNGYVETQVAYTFNTIVPYPGIPQNVVLTRVARLRVQ